MKKIENLLVTGEKYRVYGLLPYNFSSRNRTNKQTSKIMN